MAVYVGLLRGVNVGGNQKLKMAELKSLCEEAGLTDVSTYLQSGNVVFRTRKKTGVVELLRKALHARTGLDISIIVRTPAELREVIARNPVQGEPNPRALLVVFLGDALSDDVKAMLQRERAGREELHFAPRELYTYYPDGINESRLANAITDRKLKVACTARNWNTVTALAELAGRLE